MLTNEDTGCSNLYFRREFEQWQEISYKGVRFDKIKEFNMLLHTPSAFPEVFCTPCVCFFFFGILDGTLGAKN